MVSTTILLTFLLLALISSLLATSGMLFVMYLFAKAGIHHANSIRVLGSLFTGDENSSLLIGSYVHYSLGFIFGLLYLLIISYFGTCSIVISTSIGFIIGIFHGFVDAQLVVVLVAENHPLEKYRRAGFSVVFAYLLGHIAYGLILGLSVGISGIHLSPNHFPFCP